MNQICISYIITAKEKTDPKLLDLISSIEKQDLQGITYEILIITEGTSESAKAIGIRKAKGDIVCILASDNYLNDKDLSINAVKCISRGVDGAYPSIYHYDRKDDYLNRYFSIFGCNDPLAYYLGKCDRYALFDDYKPSSNRLVIYSHEIPTLGDNGFFIRRDIILHANLDSYYHIDVCEDLRRQGFYTYAELANSIWHRTGGSIVRYLARRYDYGLQHAFNKDRRWYLCGRRDYPRLAYFLICSLTLIEPTIRASFAWLKTRDSACFVHPLICLGITFTYALAMVNRTLRRISQWLSAHWGVKKH